VGEAAAAAVVEAAAAAVVEVEAAVAEEAARVEAADSRAARYHHTRDPEPSVQAEAAQGAEVVAAGGSVAPAVAADSGARAVEAAAAE
jgi:hypothetical protein